MTMTVQGGKQGHMLTAGQLGGARCAQDDDQRALVGTIGLDSRPEPCIVPETVRHPVLSGPKRGLHFAKCPATSSKAA